MRGSLSIVRMHVSCVKIRAWSKTEGLGSPSPRRAQCGMVAREKQGCSPLGQLQAAACWSGSLLQSNGRISYQVLSKFQRHSSLLLPQTELLADKGF